MKLKSLSLVRNFWQHVMLPYFSMTGKFNATLHVKHNYDGTNPERVVLIFIFFCFVRSLLFVYLFNFLI